MKINAIKIPIFRENNVLCIVAQKVHKNDWNVYNVRQPQKSLLTKEKFQQI